MLEVKSCEDEDEDDVEDGVGVREFRWLEAYLYSRHLATYILRLLDQRIGAMWLTEEATDNAMR